MHDGDVAHGEGGFAVAEVVAPFAQETWVEAEGEDGLAPGLEGVVLGAQGAGVVGSEAQSDQLGHPVAVFRVIGKALGPVNTI